MRAISKGHVDKEPVVRGLFNFREIAKYSIINTRKIITKTNNNNNNNLYYNYIHGDFQEFM